MPIVIGYDNPIFDREGYRQVASDNHGDSITTERILRGVDAALEMAEKKDAEGLSLIDRLKNSPLFVKPGP